MSSPTLVWMEIEAERPDVNAKAFLTQRTKRALWSWVMTSAAVLRARYGRVMITAGGLRNSRCRGSSAYVCLSMCVCVCIYIHELVIVSIWNFFFLRLGLF